MKNKKLISIICCATGVCMLAAGAAAGYKTANGYDALKKSLLATQDLRNCTLTADVDVEVDGAGAIQMDYLYEADLDNNITHHDSHWFYNGEDTTIPAYDYYNYNNSWYYRTLDGDYVKNEYYVSYPYENLWGISEDDRDTVDKVLRFMELAADTVVGDLRNNFVCTEDSGYYTSYRVSLDSVQIPELINAGLSVLFSMSNDTADHTTAIDENGNEYNIARDPDNMYYYTALMGDDPSVDSVTLDYTLDKDGSFRDGKAVVAFTGNGHTIAFNMSLSFSEIGTTHITTLEEQGANIIDAD